MDTFKADSTQLAAFAEANGCMIGNPLQVAVGPGGNMLTGCLAPRHHERLCLAFADGHAKALKADAVDRKWFDPTWWQAAGRPQSAYFYRRQRR